MPGILIVEDEPDIADTVRLALTRDGIGPVHVAGSLGTAREILSRADIAAAIIDIGLPDGSGLDLSVEIRSARPETAILFLTARGSEADKLAGFGVGGDDYLTKPFSPLELSARVQACLRKSRRMADSEEPLTIGRIKVGLRSGIVEIDNDPVAIPALEYKMLRFLAMNPGVAFTPSELYERVWEGAPLGHSDENNVRVHIRRLRERIEADPSNPTILVTVRGLGYRLDPP